MGALLATHFEFVESLGKGGLGRPFSCHSKEFRKIRPRFTDQARGVLDKVLAIREAKLPADHPDLAATREHLAELNAAAPR